MAKEMAYWSVDLDETEAELEAIKEKRLRYAVATINSVASDQSSVFLVIALGAPGLAQKTTCISGKLQVHVVVVLCFCCLIKVSASC
jgi:hypothetical protein